MKKLFTFISVILLITSYGEEFQKKNDLVKLKLKGRVSSLDYSVYSAVEKLGELEKDKQILRHIYQYDVQGNSTEWSLLNLDSTWDVRTYKYTYDNQENKMVENEYKSDSSLLIKHVYSYDERGNRIEKKTYGSIYTSVSSLSNTFSYKYDKQGNQIKEESYDSDGILLSSYIYTYDKQGNQIEKRVGESAKKPVKGMSFKYKYKYDKVGNRIACNSYDSAGSFDWGSVTKYDEQGNETEHIFTKNNKPPRIYSYKYEYDNSGNWTKKIKYIHEVKSNSVSLKPVVIEERKIEYYQ